MATSNVSRVLRISTQTFNIVVLALLIIMLASCDLTPRSGQLAFGKAWAATCPPGDFGAYEGVDISGSRTAKQFGGTSEQVLRDLAARSAVCSGHLRVTAFAGTSAQTVELFDGQLGLPGATDLARWRRLHDVVEGVVATVAATYADAIANGPHRGSDPVGQLRLASEYAEQLGANAHVAVVLDTDGLQSVGVSPARVSTAQEAEALADELPVPDLSGELQVVGLGHRSDGKEVASATVELLKAYWARICARTGANPCIAVTDYTSPIGSGS